MYAGFGFRKSEIGDVEVCCHEGRFHLFHLVLPNHDYIAHAVSKDGLSWRRVDNALFISDPGRWDDDMLWTMSVSPDPFREGGWRMFHTGLSLSERGRIQRIGAARSNDLLKWKKVDGAGYPLQSSFYVPHGDPHPFRPIAYGSYLEFSLDHRILLTLANEDYHAGRVGFYAESAGLRIRSFRMENLTVSPDEPYDTHSE